MAGPVQSFVLHWEYWLCRCERTAATLGSMTLIESVLAVCGNIQLSYILTGLALITMGKLLRRMRETPGRSSQTASGVQVRVANPRVTNIESYRRKTTLSSPPRAVNA